jgi:hypothetical protein
MNLEINTCTPLLKYRIDLIKISGVLSNNYYIMSKMKVL